MQSNELATSATAILPMFAGSLGAIYTDVICLEIGRLPNSWQNGSFIMS
jgi:hypothetical protein